MCSSRMRMNTSFPFQKIVQPSSFSTFEACTSLSYSNSSLRMWMRYVFKSVPFSSVRDGSLNWQCGRRVDLLRPWSLWHRLVAGSFGLHSRLMTAPRGCPRMRGLRASARRVRPTLVYIDALPCGRKFSAAVISGTSTSRAAGSPSPT